MIHKMLLIVLALVNNNKQDLYNLVILGLQDFPFTFL